MIFSQGKSIPFSEKIYPIFRLKKLVWVTKNESFIEGYYKFKDFRLIFQYGWVELLNWLSASIRSWIKLTVGQKKTGLRS